MVGANNFRNEIVWQKTNNPKGSQFERKNLGIVTDTIWWFSKTENYTFQEKFIILQLNWFCIRDIKTPRN